MNVIKHGAVKTKESEKLYKVTCDSCGCIFEAKDLNFIYGLYRHDLLVKR